MAFQRQQQSSVSVVATNCNFTSRRPANGWWTFSRWRSAHYFISADYKMLHAVLAEHFAPAPRGLEMGLARP